MKVEASDAVYYFTQADDDMYAEPDESQKYDDLQDYINNLEENGSSNLYRRIETPMTEREAFIETLCEPEAEYVNTTHGEKSLFDFLADSGKFKLVN